MENLLVRVCTSCGSEYQPEVEQCADCAVALEAPPPRKPLPPLPPIDELEAISWGAPRDLERQAQHLVDNGIPCRIETDPPGAPIRSASLVRRGGKAAARLALYVEPDTAADAHRLVRALERARLPEADELASVPAFGEELDECPGCGTPLALDAFECPDCGLAFPSGWSTCAACGASATLDDARCPRCGEPLDLDAN